MVIRLSSIEPPALIISLSGLKEKPCQQLSCTHTGARFGRVVLSFGVNSTVARTQLLAESMNIQHLERRLR